MATIPINAIFNFFLKGQTQISIVSMMWMEPGLYVYCFSTQCSPKPYCSKTFLYYSGPCASYMICSGSQTIFSSTHWSNHVEFPHISSANHRCKTAVVFNSSCFDFTHASSQYLNIKCSILPIR